MRLQVLSRMPLTLTPTGDPIHLTHIRGYLLLATPSGLAVFNTSGYNNRQTPKMVVAHPYAIVASAFASQDEVGSSSSFSSCEILLNSRVWLNSHHAYLTDLCKGLTSHGNVASASEVVQSTLLIVWYAGHWLNSHHAYLTDLCKGLNPHANVASAFGL